ncbi:hypothetical protein H6F32_05175 [Anabaena sp. FACHB-1237]|uniref:hypothetical protein n=1 Tax=Anabaena sp. FACHB-1237 TaxID=2692769 RepID=UPI0016819818|nr:hypothetical protein [Anabaena sp. FACHB-1237]MBD2136990.1 hypothetical protein [Anabaena sp. FACHB-1237]
MKKIISISSLLLCCLSLISCNESVKQTSQNTVNNTDNKPEVSITSTAEKETELEVKETKETEKPKKVLGEKSFSSENTQPKTKQPKTGTIKALVNGDLLCYVTLTDDQGRESQVGASFEICPEEKKFLNKKVRLFYKISSVNDCESAEPCGKTRKESIVDKMEIIQDKSSIKKGNNPEIQTSATLTTGTNVVSGQLNNNNKNNKNNKDTQTVSNGKWTITTGNHNSWNGVNGTGNISYKGCDNSGKCLELTGGKITCRDGKCITGWVNEDYVYIMEQEIRETGDSSPILIVRKGDQEILKETGFKVVDN